MPANHLFKVVFHSQGKVFEIYARKVGHGNLFGFVEARSPRTRSTTSPRRVRAAGPRPDRRRADDVRAGQLRALPPQDLQRRVDRRRRRSEFSLFAMIRNTHARRPDGVLSAYRDNAAVIEGSEAPRFFRPGRRRLRASATSRSTS
jgi:hypothetical protein